MKALSKMLEALTQTQLAQVPAVSRSNPYNFYSPIYHKDGGCAIGVCLAQQEEESPPQLDASWGWNYCTNSKDGWLFFLNRLGGALTCQIEVESTFIPNYTYVSDMDLGTHAKEDSIATVERLLMSVLESNAQTHNSLDTEVV
ncbi:hypothetical protein VNO77_41449 [Canavalia gladiata]|uniref:Uncharacterized protein n=1 Tax=Canavalia gladiata TaxID=3824 RepID=A0AAN9K0X0_CANGL